MNKISINVLSGESWWGGAVSDGIHMPFGKKPFSRRLDPNLTANQAAPVLISNKGRFIWSDDPFRFEFEDGLLRIEGGSADIEIEEQHGDLRGAFRAVQARKFPAKGLIPHETMFTRPQYNTWIELMYDQEQHRILEYAEAIIESGMPPGLLMIDDNWQEDYGTWNFHPGRFDSPRSMVDRLHELGFTVMLWICPFISPDSAVFRELSGKGYLVRNENGTVAVREWWNGYSAILDLTNTHAIEWFEGQLNRLQEEYGIDGFKFDGGDPLYYSDSDQCAERTTANGQCEAYARIGLNYRLNEYRACWKLAGEPLAQRLCDKAHSWDTNGLASLIPSGLSQGLMGYAFTCPDMIGGGEYVNFMANSDKLDQELFVRYAQCSALFPMMQFSAAPWRVLDQEHYRYCEEAAKLHVEFGDCIAELARHAAQTGEPIIRHMAYEFGDGPYAEVNDQFMLGSDVLVAPVTRKGAAEREIRFPEGAWRGDDGSLVLGPCVLTVSAPLSRLPWYRREV